MEACVERPGVIERAGQWVESARIQRIITTLIIINAIILGLETSPTVTNAIGPLIAAIDQAILGVFIVELVLRIAYRRGAFFRDGWSLFDLAVVLIAVLPTTPGLAVLRALRVLRVLRLITVLPRLKMIVAALLSSLPGLGMIVMLQALLFYVGAVIATKTFGPDFPDWFGTIGASLYSLFQIMTLESWSMGIVRPVMEKFPLAWSFFVPFILIATFTMLNLFIAVIVNAMQSLHEEERAEIEREVEEVAQTATDTVLAELQNLRAEIAALREEQRATRQQPAE
ncbi:ion transporter [Caenispirillum bisanense]|uniref:ion transporter n=1 Tax=Caenispirillum bisanense TaxID=414052 RepID=UPI0031D45B16